MSTAKTFLSLHRIGTRFVIATTILAIVAVTIVVSGLAQEGKLVVTPVVQDVTGIASSVQLEDKYAPVEVKDGASGMEDVAPPDAADLITATTYAFAAGADTLEDMSSGTTNLVPAASDDGNSLTFNIGFDFWFDGVRFNQFGANANGFVKLGPAPTGTSFTNSIATTTNAPKIMAYWDDLWVGTNGQVHFKVVGTAPSRKLVVEWQNMTIPRAGAATTGAGTFQMWLYESSHATLPGVIAFVYGNGIILNSANGGYSIGLQSGAATNFASVTTTGDTVSYAAANNTQTNAITAGKKYTFTPNIPAAPTGLNFTAVTAISQTINWTDNATNEFGYVIYRSTDGINFTFLTQTAAGATSFADTGLNPSTTYFYQVYAVTEGALSSPALAGSQMTAAAGNITSIASGNWSAGATWSGGVPPTAADNVTIAAGHTVEIDSSNAFSVTILSGGVLQFEATTARTLTVGSSVTINSGGTFQSNPAGTQTGHVLSIGTNLVNNGTLDFSTNADTAGAGITFTGAANNTFSGTGTTNDVRAITINKGVAIANTLELTATNFTVRGVNTDVAGFLTLTNGTFKISSAFTMTNRVFTTATYSIPVTGGIWLNNPNFTVAGQAGGTTTANNGLFRVTQGIYNIGVGIADGMGGGTGATFIIEGGTVNAAGRIDPQNAVTYTQSGGTVNVAVIGNNRSNFGSFELFSTASTFNMSGGTINVINRNTGATQVDWDIRSTTFSITGGLMVIGATGAPAATTYINIGGITPNLTINATMTNNINNAALFLRGTTVINNGAITSTGASARFDFGGPAAMSYSGTGTFGTLATPFAGVGISANSTFLTTLSAPIVVNRVNLFQGGFIGSGQITLGNGAASTTVVQIGSAGLTTPGGNFDVSPVHNQGTGGEIVLYLFETAPRTTGVEINPTRILTSMSVDNPNHVTIAGGDLTLSSTAAALTLTNGRVITGANTLILSSGTATVTRTNGYVDGNFRKTYTVTGNKNFEVGTANSYSPMAINVTALTTVPSTLTVRAVQGPHPVLNPATSLQRYWSVTEGGDVTATMTGTYATDAIDVMGNEAAYRVVKIEGVNATNFPEICPAGPCVDEAANTIVIPGVTVFSDWTASEVVPTAIPANINGRVVTNTGAPLAGVTMTLLDTILVESRTTVTDPNGFYHFNAILTGRDILVTPSRNGFTFNPQNRLFNHIGELNNVDFAGTPDSGQVQTVGNDYDGDGMADLTVFRPSEATWYTLLSATGTLKVQQWGLGDDRIVPADYDGDHVTDVAVFRPSNGTWYINLSQSSTLRSVNWGLAEDVVTPADFDGDGMTDIAVWRPSTGTWYIIQSQNGQIRTVTWGVNGDRPVAADYDGDGKADIAVWRPSNGVWYVMKIDGSYTYEHWGIEEDRVVVGDYDGDHKSDLAVFRPSTATWYVKHSSDGSTNARGHGTALDLLTPGDYDGDGMTDRAVWQLSGNWNILRSTTNTTFGTTWGTTGDIPTTSAYVR
jgi:hypothetical protein